MIETSNLHKSHGSLAVFAVFRLMSLKAKLLRSSAHPAVAKVRSCAA